MGTSLIVTLTLGCGDTEIAAPPTNRLSVAYSVCKHLFTILCLYEICVCVDTDAVRLRILQSFVFPKLIILFTITKLLLPLNANTLPT